MTKRQRQERGGNLLIPTIIIAAPDALPDMRAIADYLTTGLDDSAIFAAAIEALPSGGRLLPCGTFDFTEHHDKETT